MEAAALAEGSTLKDEDIVRLEQRWNAAKLVTHDE
jgi:hypothetical protein